MTLQEIYQPIQKDIDAVQKELKNMASTFSYNIVKDLVDYFFTMPGKYLRSSLTLLSGQAVSENTTPEAHAMLIQTAVGMELIHNASLVHDDILDNDQERRGQLTLNNKWSNRLALLTGDTLYSRAFGILIRNLPHEHLNSIVELNELMCQAEIENEHVDKTKISKEEYLHIIKGKTAFFMALCCRLGASLAGGSKEEVDALECFGLNFGMAYQLFDDNEDQDLPVSEVDGLKEGKRYIGLAQNALAHLNQTTAKDKLTDLATYMIQLNKA